MAKKITFEIDVDESGAVKSIDKIDNSVESVGKSSKQAEKGVGKLGKTLEAVGSKAGLIGLLAAAFITLKKAFESSEEGQNKLQKFFTITESIVGNLLTLISDLTMDFISLFNDPQQSLKDFAELIKENIVNRFEGLFELIPQLSKAVTQLFKGDFSGAAETAANAAGKVVLGVEDIVEKTNQAIEATVQFTKEIIKEAEVAGAIADKRAEADRKERNLIVARAEANRKIAENRERAADKENVSTQERIRLLEEAGAIAEQITQKEIEAARLRFEAIQEENKLSNSNKEALDAEAEAQARLIELETARLQQQKALTAELTTTRREAAAEEKAIADQKAAEEKAINDEKIAEEQRVADAKAKIAADLAAKELKEIERVAAIEETAKKNSINIAGDVAAAVGDLAGEGTDAAKAAGVAGVAIDVAKGLTGTLAGWSSLGPFGIGGAIASSAALVASGIKSVKDILAVKSGGKSAGSNAGRVSASAAPPAATVTPPQFSTAADTGTSQLAADINQQNEPVQAYVVSERVTNQQQLDRQVEINTQF